MVVDCNNNVTMTAFPLQINNDFLKTGHSLLSTGMSCIYGEILTMCLVFYLKKLAYMHVRNRLVLIL